MRLYEVRDQPAYLSWWADRLAVQLSQEFMFDGVPHISEHTALSDVWNWCENASNEPFFDPLSRPTGANEEAEDTRQLLAAPAALFRSRTGQPAGREL